MISYLTGGHVDKTHMPISKEKAEKTHFLDVSIEPLKYQPCSCPTFMWDDKFPFFLKPDIKIFCNLQPKAYKSFLHISTFS